MSQLFRDSTAGWTALLVVLLPLIIIGIGEVEERLRQRDSSLRRPVAIVRTWVVPLFAVWALVGVVFELDADTPIMRLLGSGLLVSLSAAALAALGVIIARIVARPRGDGRRAVPRLVLAMPRLLVYLATMWVLVAGVWAVDLSAALTALGVTSLIVSFALQDTLGGIASGFTLLADQPFQPGDWIHTGEIEGRVIDVNWRSSRIETRNGDLVVVPNGQLSKATITNYDEPTRLHRLVFPVQVAFANAPSRAKDMLLSAAHATEGVLADPPPAVLVVQVDDPLMGYEVHLWIDDYAIAPRVKSDFGSLVWYHSHRHDVPLPSPAQDLYLWDGVRTYESGRPDHAQLLAAVRSCPLIANLGDDDLDALASTARLAQFARGETIGSSDGLDAIGILQRGRAQLVLRLDGATPSVLEYLDGDLLGIVDFDETPGAVVAVTDCEVVELDVETARRVISRSPELSGAIEQISSSRQRRIERTLRRYAAARVVTELTEGSDVSEATAPEPSRSTSPSDGEPT